MPENRSVAPANDSLAPQGRARADLTAAALSPHLGRIVTGLLLALFVSAIDNTSYKNPRLVRRDAEYTDCVLDTPPHQPDHPRGLA